MRGSNAFKETTNGEVESGKWEVKYPTPHFIYSSSPFIRWVPPFIR